MSMILKEADLLPLADVLGTALTITKKDGEWAFAGDKEVWLRAGSLDWIFNLKITESLVSHNAAVSGVVLSGMRDLKVLVLLDHIRNSFDLYLLDALKVDTAALAGRILPKEWTRKRVMFAIRNAVLERYTAVVGGTEWAQTADPKRWVQQYLMAREEGRMDSDTALGFADAVDCGAVLPGEFKRWSTSTKLRQQEMMIAALDADNGLE